MKRILALAISISALTGTAVHADDNLYAAQTGNGDVRVFVNLTSLKKLAGNTYKTWVTYVFANPKTDIKYFKHLELFDCDNETSQTLASVGYDSSDNAVGSSQGPQPLNYIVPESAGSQVYAVVCAGDQRKVKYADRYAVMAIDPVIAADIMADLADK